MPSILIAIHYPNKTDEKSLVLGANVARLLRSPALLLHISGRRNSTVDSAPCVQYANSQGVNADFRLIAPPAASSLMDELVNEQEMPVCTQLLDAINDGAIEPLLLVLGTNETDPTGLSGRLGPLAATAIRECSRCPVLVVRPTTSLGGFCEVPPRPLRALVCHDVYSPCALSVIDAALPFFHATRSLVTILHVHMQSDVSQIYQLLADATHRICQASLHCESQVEESETVVGSNRVVAAAIGARICRFLENNNFDYVVLGTHGGQDPDSRNLGSVAEWVVTHSSIPALTFGNVAHQAHVHRPSYDSDSDS